MRQSGKEMAVEKFVKSGLNAREQGLRGGSKQNKKKKDIFKKIINFLCEQK